MMILAMAQPVELHHKGDEDSFNLSGAIWMICPKFLIKTLKKQNKTKKNQLAPASPVL